MALEQALLLGERFALEVYAALTAEQQRGAAAMALFHGRPALAARWAQDEPLTRAAALLRLGEPALALETLAAEPHSARPALLRARAYWQLGKETSAARIRAQQARTLARQEGDTPALVAAATLIGEQQLDQPYAALRTLAEGLKVTELAGQDSDAHLLAVLSHVHLRLGGTKGQRTAARALERSAPRSPARVIALLGLRRSEDARAEAEDGRVGAVWLRPFLPHGAPEGGEAAVI